MDNAFLGSSYNNSQIRKILLEKKIKFQEFPIEQIIQKTAQLIYDGKVVGWFQNKSEWGPRALGNRSILANPIIKNMKEIINLKIKKRESFRPFAPSVLVLKFQGILNKIF